MMIFISLTQCPPILKGDLTRWLFEVNTNIYVGNVSARVRDALWHRIIENVHYGRVTMVFRTPNAQGFDFRTHNSQWQPIDFDGIKLMMRPHPNNIPNPQQKSPISKLEQRHKARQILRNKAKNKPKNYIIIDIETTGLSLQHAKIIELAALKIENNQVQQHFTTLVQITTPIPPKITTLTGITDAQLHTQGIPLTQALQKYIDFIGNSTLVGHNIKFDLEILRHHCLKNQIPPPSNLYIDTLKLAKKAKINTENYKLNTLLQHFHYASTQRHRALADCHAVHFLYGKLFDN